MPYSYYKNILYGLVVLILLFINTAIIAVLAIIKIKDKIFNFINLRRRETNK